MISFVDQAKARKLLDRIHENAAAFDRIRLMEVCGTHTMEIGRIGLRSMLPENVELVSGPGCPVCVTPASIIDSACTLAIDEGCTILTFGDMIRVPGKKSNLEMTKSQGGKVETLLSPLHAISMASSHPSQVFVFIAVGFETTIPAVARTVELACEKNLDNLFFLTAHRTVPPALESLVSDKSIEIDGILLPGHVVSICGIEPFKNILKNSIPAAVTGFESLDILLGISAVIEMLKKDDFNTVNMYRRVVKDEGNPVAIDLINRVFESTDALWRGIGVIPGSGLALRKKYERFCARIKFAISDSLDDMPDGCSCGKVLKGMIRPSECPLFGFVCSPETPLGPCMVSSEGSCAAYYKYGDR
jgi:hydrogenase expression/formation protein HypD